MHLCLIDNVDREAAGAGTGLRQDADGEAVGVELAEQGEQSGRQPVGRKPAVLLARVVYLYRRQRIHALAAQLDEVLVIRDFEATRDFEAMVDAEVGAPGAVPAEEVGEAGGERVRSATGVETRSQNADQNESATAGRHAPLAV